MKKTNIKMEKLRLWAALGLVLVVMVGVQTKLDWGSVCSYCPLGFMQISLAGRSIPLELLLPVILVTIGIIVLGRVFCAWLCPTALLKGLFKGNKDSASGSHQCHGQCSSCAEVDTAGRSYIGYGVMGATLIASFIFKFPVFCLICPVGLFFGFGYAVFRLSTIYQPGWELIIFPLMLIFEVFILRSWCSSFCPLGAMFRLLGKLGLKTKIAVRPKTDQGKCFQAQGVNCSVCKSVCPEQLTMPIADEEGLEDCTLCLECYQHCPNQAITIGFIPGHQNNK